MIILFFSSFLSLVLSLAFPLSEKLYGVLKGNLELYGHQFALNRSKSIASWRKFSIYSFFYDFNHQLKESILDVHTGKIGSGQAAR